MVGTGLATVLAAHAGVLATAHAADPVPAPALKPQAPGSRQGASGKSGNHQPVLVNADRMAYDNDTGKVTATGNVELAQGDRVLKADQVTYDPNSDTVTATGHVRMLDPSGNVVFGDYVILTDDMKQGFIRNARMLMTDNSRMAGAEGDRTDGRYTRFNHGVYSPCKLCVSDPTAPPLWQVKAGRIIHDNQTHDIIYRDAQLDLYGLPIAYTPYLTTPDPTVKRRTGILTPTYGNSPGLGTYVRSSYYWDIAPDKDATFQFTPMTNQYPVVGGEYRQRFEKGSIRLDGSLTYATRTTDSGGTTKDELRGHIFASGRFDYNDTWRYGFDLQHASDKSYLEKYHYAPPDFLSTQSYTDAYKTSPDFLTSRAFVEGFGARDYAAIEAYTFQDLRTGRNSNQPYVAPLAQYDAMGLPGEMFGGRWAVNTSFLNLFRNGGNDTRRLATEADWQRELFFDNGLAATFTTLARFDGYNVDKLARADLAGDPTVSSNTLRFFPQAEAMFRYPLIRHGHDSYQLIEPELALVAAPNLHTYKNIPNNDSQSVEFSDTNLFALNRFQGVDQIEGGSRATYGLKFGSYWNDGRSISGFIGQDLRLHKNDQFSADTGLEANKSDYVGRLVLQPSSWFDLWYSGRFDHATFAPRVHDLSTDVGNNRLRVSASYLYQDKSQIQGVPAVRELSYSVSSQLTDYWRVQASQSRSFATTGGGLLDTSGSVIYEDECFIFALTLSDNNTSSSPDSPGGVSFVATLVFKGLGAVALPSISAF